MTSKYITCPHCEWDIKQSYYDPHIDHCVRCNNTREILDPRQLLCNLCGGEMYPSDMDPMEVKDYDPHGLYDAKVTGYYGYDHLVEQHRYTFSFCEKCLRQLFVQCKVKPLIEEMSSTGSGWDCRGVCGTIKWEQDQEDYEYKRWREDGGHHQAYLDRKCNAIKDCSNDAIYTVEDYDGFTEECSCEDHKGQVYYVGGGTFTKFIPNNLRAFL